MSEVLTAIGGSLGGAVLGAHFNAREAAKNRRFQKKMSDTAYQRAAQDLEAAGLNRVLALGSPSSTPAGSAASINAPDFGSTYISASSAKSQIALQRQQEALVKEQAATEKTQQELNQESAVLARAGADAKQQETITGQAIEAANRASAVRDLSQAKLNDQNARVSAAEAAKQETLKLVYKGMEPLVQRLGDWMQRASSGANDVKSVPGGPHWSLRWLKDVLQLP